MRTVDLVQGSPEWDAHRAVHKNASAIAVIMGIDKNRKRDDFIIECATGIRKKIDGFTQKLFADGHRHEELARPIAEDILGDDLFPVVGVATISGIDFSASYDGITFNERTVWEHKGLNADLARKIPAGVIDKMYKVQMEVQLQVSGADRVLFMASKDGDKETEVHCWYESETGLMDEIVAACIQFDKDVAAYVPVEAVVEPVAVPAGALPAIQYNLNGLQITSNLDEYSAAAKQLVEDSKLPMTTDQEFADAELRNKALRKAVKNIGDVCERVIQEVSDIYQFRETLHGIGEQLRQAALNGEKQVKARKEQMRFEIINEAKGKLISHCATLEDEFGHAWLTGYVKADFAGAAKGKSKLSSVQSAVNDELARAKIEADAVARKIRANLKTLKEDAGEYRFLFADVRNIIYKDPEDFITFVYHRVEKHKIDEKWKEAARREEEERKIAEREECEERKAKAEREAMLDKTATGIVDACTITVAKADKLPNESLVQVSGNVSTEIIDSLVSHGIKTCHAARVAQLIVAGKVARVYCQ